MSNLSNISFELDNSKKLKNDTPGPKFLIMKRLESNSTLKDISPFLIKKTIDTVCGEIDSCKTLTSGDKLIKTKNAIQAAKLIKLIALSPTIKIEVSEHFTLNSSKGVIYCNSLREIKEEEILFELKAQNVTEVKKILKKEGETLKETGLIIFTFSTPELPLNINIGYEKIPMRPYIPLPMKCRNCHRYGHLAKFCKNSIICANCGCPPHTDENNPVCLNKPMCINCNENELEEKNHSSNDKKCPIFIKQKEIQAIKITQKVDIRTALQTCNVRNRYTTSFATTVRNPIRYSSDEKLYKSEQSISSPTHSKSTEPVTSPKIKKLNQMKPSQYFQEAHLNELKI